MFSAPVILHQPHSVGFVRVHRYVAIASSISCIHASVQTRLTLNNQGFIWGGTCFCVLLWAFFRLPETKGRTYEELDVLFSQKISARKFENTNVGQLTHREREREPLVQGEVE